MHAWFLKIAFVCEVISYVFVCMLTLKAIK